MGLQNLEFDFEIGPNSGAGGQAVDFGEECDLSGRFQYWNGASGERYIHTVYSLVDLPELPRINYLLVHRDERGRCAPLRIGRTTDSCRTANLAEIRYRAARLGANEVHIHMIADTSRDRALVECDLRAGQFRALSAERAGKRLFHPDHSDHQASRKPFISDFNRK